MHPRLSTGRTCLSQIISSGPYRYVRHPSSSTLLVNVLGIGAASGDWLSLILMSVFAGIGLGQRTSRQIPFIY